MTIPSPLWLPVPQTGIQSSTSGTIMSLAIQKHHVAPQTVQEVSDALTQVWEETPQENLCCPTRSMARRCRGGYRHLGAPHTTQPHFELLHLRRWSSLWSDYYTFFL